MKTKVYIKYTTIFIDSCTYMDVVCKSTKDANQVCLCTTVWLQVNF